MMYQVESPVSRAMGGMSQASSTYGKMTQDIPAHRAPGPTTGGAMLSGFGGAAAGAQMGDLVSSSPNSGGYGAIAGTAIGIGGYLLF